MGQAGYAIMSVLMCTTVARAEKVSTLFRHSEVQRLDLIEVANLRAIESHAATSGHRNRVCLERLFGTCSVIPATQRVGLRDIGVDVHRARVHNGQLTTCIAIPE